MSKGYNDCRDDAMFNNVMEVLEEAEAMIYPDLQDALVAYTTSTFGETRAVYDRDKCISILVSRDGMTEEEAIDYFGYNTECAYFGDKTPIIIQSILGEYNE